MSLTLTVARVAAVVNVVLLLTLAWVWAGTYREVRSTQTLGTLSFALLLLAENLLAAYYYLVGPTIAPPAIRAMMYLQILETAALLVLAYVTWQ